MEGYSSFTVVKNEILAYEIAELLEKIVPKPVGIGVFKIEDGSDYWEVGSFFLKKPDNSFFFLIEKIFDLRFVISALKNDDWVEKVQRDLKPVFLKCYVISNNHYLKKIKTNKIKINIEASMAFGTGHHGTTIGCLKAIELLSKKKINVKNYVDLGTGTGLLAMGISKKFKIKGFALDYDLTSCKVAKKNICKNGLNPKIILRWSNGFKNKTVRKSAPFDLIIANILLKPLCILVNEFKLNLKKRGFLILSGITKSQLRKLYSVFTSNNFFLYKKIIVGEWVTVILRL